MTLGEATQLFKKATNLDIDIVKEIIEYTVPNMEWHHAGKLPKAYGGGMKKTYFLNASEICNVATNWNDFLQKLELSKQESKSQAENERQKKSIELEFLKINAEYISRVTTMPEFFYKTAQEMHGKYGWFDSTYKSYNMTEYFSGWEFQEEKKYHEFLNL